MAEPYELTRDDIQRALEAAGPCFCNVDQHRDDIARIQHAVAQSFGCDITEDQAASFWEEVSDPLDWKTLPPDSDEIAQAFYRFASP